MTIGERIRVQRKRINIKQEELSDRLGVSAKTIQRWEAGERMPNTKMLPKLAEVLDTSEEYLMGLNNTDTLPQTSQLEQLIQKVIESRIKDINKEEKIKDPLLGTEYPLKKPQEYLNLSYWGEVAENAKLAAQFGTEQDKTAVLMMLNVAVNALQKACIPTSTEKTAQNVGVQ